MKFVDFLVNFGIFKCPNRVDREIECLDRLRHYHPTKPLALRVELSKSSKFRGNFLVLFSAFL